MPIEVPCKYFVPLELWPNSTKPYRPYYSGAGFVLNKDLLTRMIAKKDLLPNFPIDDAYMGELFHQAGETNDMLHSDFNLGIFRYNCN